MHGGSRMRLLISATILICSAQAVAAPPPPASPSVKWVANTSFASQLSQGDVAMAALNFRDAVRAYQQAAKSDPTSVQAYFRFGNASFMAGRKRQAIDAWESAFDLSTDPAFKAALRRRIAQGEDFPEKFATIDPFEPTAESTPVSVAAPASKVGDSKMENLPDTTASAPTPPPPAAPAASTSSGPPSLAVTSTAEPQLSNVVRGDYEAGVAAIGLGQYADALVRLNAALRGAPGFASGYVARGTALLGLKRYAEASVDYNYASRLDSHIASPWYGMGESYRALGRIDEARNAYSAFLSSSAADATESLKSDARKKIAGLK